MPQPQARLVDASRRGARWPNLFVAGAQKAGTTSLWHYLGAHPDVYMSAVKEPHFFAPRGRPAIFVTVDEEEAYLRLFEGASGKRYLGEASTGYLVHRETAARIREASPEAKVVISLREPVLRAYSAYWWARRLGVERRSFLAAVRDELESPDALGYVGRGLYAEQVERYLAEFGDAVHVMFLEELAADVRGEVRRLFEFLDLDAEAAEAVDTVPHHSFVWPRNPLAASLLRSPLAGRLGRASVPARLRPRIERVLTRPRPEMEPEARALLHDVFAPVVAELERVLARPAPWGET